jgi:hypothetical protein
MENASIDIPIKELNCKPILNLCYVLFPNGVRLFDIQRKLTSYKPPCQFT